MGALHELQSREILVRASLFHILEAYSPQNRNLYQKPNDNKVIKLSLIIKIRWQQSMAINPENRRIFEDARNHLNQASLKNSEQLDKAVLSLSSFGLALSLSFSKFIVPISEADCIWVLHIAWCSFGIAIMTTVFSFVTCNSSIIIEREYIYKYYIDEDDEYATKKNTWGIVTYWLNRITVVSFLVAILSIISYVWINTQEPDVSKQKENQEKGYVIPKREPVNGNQNNNSDKNDSKK